jgi:hypothetical protein
MTWRSSEDDENGLELRQDVGVRPAQHLVAPSDLIHRTCKTGH